MDTLLKPIATYWTVLLSVLGGLSWIISIQLKVARIKVLEVRLGDLEHQLQKDLLDIKVALARIETRLAREGE